MLKIRQSFSNLIHSRFFFSLLPIFFLIISLATIYDYGMNWDSPIHFARGQSYLRYILTGKTNYEGLPQPCQNAANLTSSVDYQTGEVCDRHRKIRVSEYQSVLFDLNSWIAKAVYGHPAFSDLMLATSNNIFYKGLGLLEDIPAYHLYNILTTFLLALVVSIWAKQTFGIFASIVAVLVVYTFPLLAGEQHFNVKDPPMAAFFSLSLYLFWLGFEKKKTKYLIMSALAGGASFGTKFNFIFAPFILLPWITAYLITERTRLSKLLTKQMILALIFYPAIVFLVFFATWPALWSDPFENVSEVIRYYREIGGSKCSYFYFTPLWFSQCTQSITLKYFLFTLPPFSLFLFLIGSIVSLVRFKKKRFITILWLSFFYFSILRVTFSISSIYGGLRQIMEFITPMALLSGVGALFLRNYLMKFLPNKRFWSGLLILGFIPISVTLVKLHPNENVYFNSFLGGLHGAAEKNFPGYGNTYGNAYMQGIIWLNANAEKDNKLALTSGLGQNLSRGQIRSDIDYSNNYRSGYNQEGEYQMLLIEGNDPLAETFRYKYLLFLKPVYILEVDGVELLKIWKNDKSHLKNNLNFDSQIEKTNIQFKDEQNHAVAIIQLNGQKKLKALVIKLKDQTCKDGLVGTKILISIDGSKYFQKAEGVNNFSDREIFGYGGDFVYLFPGDEAEFIKIVPPAGYSCSLQDIDFSVTTFIQLQQSNQ